MPKKTELVWEIALSDSLSPVTTFLSDELPEATGTSPGQTAAWAGVYHNQGLGTGHSSGLPEDTFRLQEGP